MGLVFGRAGLAFGQQTRGPGAIDIHAHMPLLKFGGPLAPRFSRTTPQSSEAAKGLASAIQQDSFAEVAALRVADMDAWGVAKSAAMPIDFGAASAAEHWAEHEALAQACRRHPGRLALFFACDPRRPGSVELLDRAVEELGAQGVKIHPLAGFAVDDEDACYQFYAKCAELNLPVVGHCRPVGNAARDALAQPGRYGNVAADLPDLRICLGHLGGGPWTDAALDVIEAHPNAYGDISNLQPLFDSDPARFGAILRRIANGPARARVMYATDWPSQRPLDERFLRALDAGAMPAMNDELHAKLTRENAAAFLRGSEANA